MACWKFNERRWFWDFNQYCARNCGGFVGGWLFEKLGISFIDGLVGDLLEGVIGAVVILFIAGLIKKK